MPITKIDVPELLPLSAALPVIDVRSEGEYLHAHFPGAHSLPLFNNTERSVVGTAYKQESREKAIKLGLQYFGPKMVGMIEQVEKLLHDRPRKAVVVYCWRGGMRSGGVAWLLDLYGIEVFTVVGGYKAFRKWGMQLLEQDHPLQLIGGFTGSAKTEVLAELKRKGQAVIDLEALACHKGSAFGNFGMPVQPSQEQFENKLAVTLWSESGCARTSWAGEQIWIEDESQRIGSVNIPIGFYRMMQTKPVYFLEVPFAERCRHIVSGYGKAEQERLVNAIIRIRKRLGGLEAKNAINHILEGDIESAFAILLRYYDKQYAKTLELKTVPPHQVQRIPCESADAAVNARLIIAQQKQSIHV